MLIDVDVFKTFNLFNYHKRHDIEIIIDSQQAHTQKSTQTRQWTNTSILNQVTIKLLIHFTNVDFFHTIGKKVNAEKLDGPS